MYKSYQKENAVRAVQQYLITISKSKYSPTPNGKYDEKTQVAVEDFQKRMNLSPTGSVDKKITLLPDSLGAFKGVSEAVCKLSEFADICVVSSANRGAIEEEWNRCSLTKYVSLMMDQSYGSKAFCISELVKMGGYEKEKVLMVGDALGDLKAAKSNDVLYYPILVNKEEFSWERLKDEGLKKLLAGEFQGDYQASLEKEFYDNLS